MIWLVLVPAIIVLVKDKPQEIGMLPDGLPVSDDVSVAAATTGLSLREALRTPIFWILALVRAAAVFYPIFVTTQQFILQATKIGLSPQQASFSLSALFFVSVAGKFLFGWLSDRFSGLTHVMVACCLVMFGSTLVLLDLTPASVFAFLLPFGFGYGGTFVLLQRIAADFFGNRDYPRILGVLIVIETVGAAIGGLITGRLADASGGDYTTAFYAVIGVSGAAFVLTVLLSLMSRRMVKVGSHKNWAPKAEPQKTRNRRKTR